MYRTNVMDDSSKWILFGPKSYLATIGYWPGEGNDIFTKTYFWFNYVLAVFLAYGQLAFLLNLDHDITKTISTLITLSPTVQVFIS